MALKYSGKCSKCGSYLPVGKQAIWVSASKSVHCIKCPDNPTIPPPRTKNSSIRESSDNLVSRSPIKTQNTVFDTSKISSENLEWYKYCNYLADCVFSESQIEPPSVENKQRYKVVSTDSESPISKRITLDTESKTFLEKIESGKSVIVGWPILCIEGKEGRRIVPIIQAEVDVSSTLESGNIEFLNSEWRICDLLNSTSQIDASDVEILQENLKKIMDEKSSTIGKKIESELSNLWPSWKEAKAKEPSQLAVGEFSSLPIILIGAETQFSQTLVQELRELSTRSDWKDTAAGQLFNYRNLPEKESPEIIAPLALNESQEEAISKLSSNIAVVVTGPPGTGKSQLISSLVAQSWLTNHSLLVTSVNNAAVDVAVERIKNLEPSLVLRTGNKASREALSAEIESFSDRAGLIQINARDAKYQVDQARRLFLTTYRQRKSKMESYRKYLKLHNTIAEISEELISLNFELWKTGICPINKKIWVLKFLTKRLAAENVSASFKHTQIRKYIERKYKLNDFELPYLEKWLSLRSEFNKAKKSLDRNSHNVITEKEMKNLDESWKEDSQKLLTALVRATLQKNKSSLTSLRSAVLKGQYQAAISSSNLKLFPSWAVTAYSAATAIPLTAGHIDLVVVDEASQCSIAATIPLAYRAKQIMILGDLNQLRPIVKLSEIEEKFLATKREMDIESLRSKKMDHKTSSAFAAYDYIVPEMSKVLLDEHYRSHSSISHWFNANFYSGNLTLLGSRPSKGIEQGISWIEIFGTWQRGERGSYLNSEECQEVVKIVKNYADLALSIGVVTPYARQAQEIRELLSKSLSEEQQHEIEFVSSTAHRFQGGEKDLIIYSTVITPETPQRSADWIKKNRELINVAVSRAREALIVVGHPEAALSLNIGDLVSLRKAALMKNENLHGEDLLQTKAEKALYLGLLDRGLAAAPQLPISGVIVDLAIPSEKSLGLAIEVDGSVHQDSRGIRVRQDIQRDRMLRDLGWQVLRIPNWRVFSELNLVIDEIIQEIENSHSFSV